MTKALGVLLSLIALGTALVAVQREIDRRLGPYRAQEETLYLWSGQHLKRLVPGFEGLAADVYWLRTVQYFGGQRLFAKEKRFDLLGPLTEITTTLDPRMEIAYRYGAVFLSEPPPVGAGRPEEGLALLERGAKNIPMSWRLRQDWGFFTYIFLKDSQRAAVVLVEASRLPGAPFWLATLAAEILGKGGDRVSARRMWAQMYEQAEGDFIKVNAQQHLLVLDALDQSERLSAAVLEFERRFGRRPARLEDLPVPSRALVDSAGVPFVYDPATGLVTVYPKSPLWRPN